MIHETQIVLHRQAKGAGISAVDIARRVDVKINTLRSWLNGYAEMPARVRSEIVTMIRERQPAVTTVTADATGATDEKS